MEFKCKKCGFCCKNGIIILYPEDINAISVYLGLQTVDFIRMHCKKTKISIDSFSDIDVYYLDVSNSCEFLSEENLCKINEVKPLQCKLSPNSYFNSIGTWKNCIQFFEHEEKPFYSDELPDDFFVRKLLKGYSLN